MIDTHSHLYDPKFEADGAEVLARARAVLNRVYLPNIDRESVAPMHALVAQDPDFFRPMMGLHPCSVGPDFEAVLDEFRARLDAHQRPDNAHVRYWGIGECGLDLYWDKTTLPMQQEALRTQIGWAKHYDLPMSLHAREAIDQTADLIEAHLGGGLRGVFHCFSGTLAQARRIMAFGTFAFGMGGVVTYSKKIPAVIRQIPLEYIVLETDSPYMTPAPHRGTRNESSYTAIIAQTLADLYGISVDELGRITDQNAARIFGE